MSPCLESILWQGWSKREGGRLEDVKETDQLPQTKQRLGHIVEENRQLGMERGGPLDAGSSLPLSLIYLFLAVLGLPCCTRAFSSWGEWGLPSGSGAQASDCSGFSCGANALGLQGSAAVAHRFGCPEACGIFPDQGSTPCPLHWQADS